ncbi:hypothetical protein GCM10027167_10900 [Nocardia heshunensis]
MASTSCVLWAKISRAIAIIGDSVDDLRVESDTKPPKPHEFHCVAIVYESGPTTEKAIWGSGIDSEPLCEPFVAHTHTALTEPG